MNTKAHSKEHQTKEHQTVFLKKKTGLVAGPESVANSIPES